MQLLLLLVPCLVSAAPQQFSTLAQAQAAAQAQEDRLNGQAAFANSQAAFGISQSAFGNPQVSFGNSQPTFDNSQPSFGSQSASRTEGFGDASDQEIAEIRAGTYKETFDDNPEYNFRYKVADETEQTYMAMEEQRAGDTVTGSYQYVDPLGSLIVVNYSAGPGGYQETREVKPNFVTIRARPVRTQVQQTSRPSRPFTSAQRPQSNIVSQIVAQIQPLVSQTVTSAVGSSSGALRFSSRPATGGRTVTIRTRPGRTQFRQRTGRLQTVRPADQQTVSSDSLAQKLDEQKQDAQSQEDQKQEAQNQEAQRLESQRLESERLEAQKLEAQALVDQRLEAQRLEAQTLEAQRQEAQKQEAHNQETQRQEGQRQQAASQAPADVQAEANRLNAQAASSNSQSNFVSQIVAQIKPLVSQTVTSAVGSSSGAPGDSSRPAPVGRTVTRVRVPARNIPAPTAPVLVASGSSGDLSSVFGQGGAYNVRFNTPDFNIEY